MNRPYCLQELKDLESELHDKYRLSNIFAQHYPCGHKYRVKKGGRKEQFILDNTTLRAWNGLRDRSATELRSVAPGRPTGGRSAGNAPPSIPEAPFGQGAGMRKELVSSFSISATEGGAIPAELPTSLPTAKLENDPAWDHNSPPSDRALLEESLFDTTLDDQTCSVCFKLRTSIDSNKPAASVIDNIKLHDSVDDPIVSRDIEFLKQKTHFYKWLFQHDY